MVRVFPARGVVASVVGLAAVAAAVPARRFATMCVVDAAAAEASRAAVAARCAAHVCSLALSTAPDAPPLALAAGLDATQAAALTRAGAEVVEVGLPAVDAAAWRGAGAVRRYTFHKLHVFDPAVARATRVAFLDSDSLVVRNASRVFEFEPLAALPVDARCGLWTGQAPTVALPSGVVARRDDAYFNSGVLVVEPDAAVAADLWAAYVSRAFAHVDAGSALTEQDLLQTKFYGTNRTALPDAFNFRGYQCPGNPFNFTST